MPTGFDNALISLKNAVATEQLMLQTMAEEAFFQGDQPLGEDLAVAASELEVVSKILSLLETEIISSPDIEKRELNDPETRGLKQVYLLSLRLLVEAKCGPTSLATHEDVMGIIQLLSRVKGLIKIAAS